MFDYPALLAEFEAISRAQAEKRLVDTDYDYASDFLGSRVRLPYIAGSAKTKTSAENPGQWQGYGFPRMRAMPIMDDEIFEWAAILEAVKNAGDSFTMLDFGAGYGRWAIRAYLAAMARGIKNIKIGLVEAEPTHLEWLRQALHDNEIPPAHVDLYPYIAGTASQEAYFYVAMPDGSPGNDPQQWYGQARVGAHERVKSIDEDGIATLYSGWKAVKTVEKSALDIITSYPRIDLIDMDIQGAELEVVISSIKELSSRVKYLHISTHSKVIEFALIHALKGAGWVSRQCYSCLTTNKTEYGDIPFNDGHQSWVNPRFVQVPAADLPPSAHGFM